DVHLHPALWERAAEMVRAGFMPPPDARRPAPDVLESFVSTVERRLDEAAAAAPNPGWKGISRLNRAEYRNAIRDLLAFDASDIVDRSEEHTSELQSRENLVCRLLLEKNN